MVVVVVCDKPERCCWGTLVSTPPGIISEGVPGAELVKPGISIITWIHERRPGGVAGVLQNLVGGCRGRPDRLPKAIETAACAFLPVRNDDA